jgi:Na+/melibiose symporter-like transporter
MLHSTSGLLETVNRVLGGVISQRWWIGLLPLAAIALALPRLNGLGLISVVWTLAAALPAAILLATWEGEYIDRRYLYIPSVGLAVLGAHALYALRRRRLWTAVLFSVACSWSILWVGFGLWKMTRDAADPVQQANQERFSSEMGALSPRWED